MDQISLKIRREFCTALCCAAILAGCAPQGGAPAASAGTAPVEAAGAASSAASAHGAIDLTDYNALTDIYLRQPFYSGVTAQNWDTPRDIDGGALVDFYGVYWTKEHPDEQSGGFFPAAEAEAYVRQFFTADPTETMRAHARYDAEQDAYEFTGLGGGASGRVVGAALNGDVLTLDYEVYSAADDRTVIRSGALAVALREDGGFQYMSHRVRYPKIETSATQERLDELTETYIKPLNPNGALVSRTWASVSELTADELIGFCAFNNFLELPRDFEGLYEQGPVAPAAEVEAAVTRYFAVDAAFLKTSQFYDAAADAYALPGGFGGGWTTRAFDERERDGFLIITTGVIGPDDEPDRPSRTATLTIAPQPDGGFWYESFIING